MRASGGTVGSPSSAWCRLPYGVAPRQRLRYLARRCRVLARSLARGVAPRPRPQCPSIPNLTSNLARRRVASMLQVGFSLAWAAKVEPLRHGVPRNFALTLSCPGCCAKDPPLACSLPHSAGGGFSGPAARRASLVSGLPSPRSCLPDRVASGARRGDREDVETPLHSTCAQSNPSLPASSARGHGRRAARLRRTRPCPGQPS